MACDPNDHIYVVEAINQRVQSFDNNGNYILGWSTNGSWDTNPSDPDGITCDFWGNVYTPDYNNFCVYKYTNTGTYECKIGSQGTNPGQFGLCSCGVRVDKSGICYVSDYGNKRMEDFNLFGNFLCQWGTTGTNALGNIDYFCLSSSGNVYIADNNCIKVFGP